MKACAVWLEVDALIRLGFTIEDHGDRRTATRDGQTYVLAGVCRCPAEDCPPHPVEPAEVAA